jgi:hypothetical protein
LGQEQGLQRSVQQVMDALEIQKHQIGENKKEVPGIEAFLLADAVPGEMALNMQHEKSFLNLNSRSPKKFFRAISIWA